MTVSSRNGRLTPDQVQSISFPPARFGRRGLDEETVHAFCDHVQHELMTLLKREGIAVGGGRAAAAAHHRLW